MPRPRTVLTWAHALGLLVLVQVSQATAQTTQVRGRVIDASTNLPVAGIEVSVRAQSGDFIASGTTNASGVYVIDTTPGPYYFLAAESTTYVGEVWPDVQCREGYCSGSDLQAGTSFSILFGETLTRDFALTRAGRITGTVINQATGQPAAAVLVEAAFGDPPQRFATSAATNSQGQYTFEGLPPGTYFLWTRSVQGLQDEIFGGGPCVGSCEPAQAVARGTPVVVASRATVSGRDFALSPGGFITGRVTNRSTGLPVAGVHVTAVARGPARVALVSGVTNAAGHYVIAGLATADYAVYTETETLTNQIHGGLLCPVDCSRETAVESGARVSVRQGLETGGIDFALDPGGRITGRVELEGIGAPVQNALVTAIIEVGTSILTRNVFTDASGVYEIAGLPTGTVALMVRTATSSEIFDNIPCQATGCDLRTALRQGTPVSVVAGQATTVPTVVLTPRLANGVISGLVADPIPTQGIAGVVVALDLELAPTVFVNTRSSVTDRFGGYRFEGLPHGTYRVHTGGSHPYVNEVFDNVPCLGPTCAPAAIRSGRPVTVAGPTPVAANFLLSRGDSVTGRITNASGDPLESVLVRVFRLPTGTLAGTGFTGSSGRYTVRGLPNGSYVAHTVNTRGFADETYFNVPCPGACTVERSLVVGAPIQVTGATVFGAGDESPLVSGIDFTLGERAPGAPTNLRARTSGFTTTFTWNPPSLVTGGAARTYVIEAGGSPGATSITLPVETTSLAVPGVPPGTYFVRVRGVSPLGTGPASNEIRLVVTPSGTAPPDAPDNVVAFVSGDRLTMTWAPPTNVGPGVSFVVEAGSTSGATNIATLPVAVPAFSFAPVPDGVYFLRVRARNAAGVSTASREVMIVAGGVPAPPGAPVLRSPAVSGASVTLAWDTPVRGTPTSYRIEAGSAPGLSNLAIVDTGSAAPSQTFTGVPPGTYVIRVRAVNARGVGVASNEVTLTVP